MGQSSSSHERIRHAIGAGDTVNTAKLKREFNAYLSWQGNKESGRLTRATMLRFVSDAHDLLGLITPDAVLAENVVLPQYSFEEFVAFFVNVVALGREVDLSTSLNPSFHPLGDASKAALESLSRGNNKKMDDVGEEEEEDDDGGEGGDNDDSIRPSVLLEPDDVDEYCPPSTIAQREWALIAERCDDVTLESLNRSCRFFRTVLRKYPPESWRVARVSRPEELQNPDVGLRIGQLRRMRRCARLQIGVTNCGCMLRGDHLKKALSHLPHLRALRLLWCQMVRLDMKPLEPPLHNMLTSLTLFQTECPIKSICQAFPALQHLVLAGQCQLLEVSNETSFTYHLSDLRQLRLLGISDVFLQDGPRNAPATHPRYLQLDRLGEMPNLTSLWLEGLSGRADDSAMSKRNCFSMSHDDEVKMIRSCSALRTYVCGARDEHFIQSVAGVQVTQSAQLPYVFPKMASFSWLYHDDDTRRRRNNNYKLQ